jgi:hypothetical protein
MFRMREGKNQNGSQDGGEVETPESELSWIEKVTNAASSWEKQQMETENEWTSGIARGVNAMNCNDVLSTALTTIRDRNKDYGDIKTSFQKAAIISSAMLDKTITAYDVAVIANSMMQARLSNNPKHQDSWVHMAAYTSIAAQLSGDRPAMPEARFMDNVESGLKEALGIDNAN